MVFCLGLALCGCFPTPGAAGSPVHRPLVGLPYLVAHNPPTLQPICIFMAASGFIPLSRSFCLSLPCFGLPISPLPLNPHWPPEEKARCPLRLLKTLLPVSKNYRNMVSMFPLNSGSRKNVRPHMFFCQGVIFSRVCGLGGSLGGKFADSSLAE